MARRSQPTPQTEYQVLEARILALENSVRRLQSAGRSTFLTSDADKHLDPVQGEVIVHHPGTHTPAAGEGAQYYHDGAWRSFSGLPPVPWIRRSMTYQDTELTIQGVSIDDEETLNFTVTEGSENYTEFFSAPTGWQITGKLHGVYAFMVEVIWKASSVPGDFPSWLYLHDTIGMPTAIPTHSRPSGYGQLGSTLAGFWRGRYKAFTPFQIDVAQLSGSDKIVDAAYFEIHYIGDYTGPERVDGNPDQ